jgi:multiple sugar transport system substrate-binding protein
LPALLLWLGGCSAEPQPGGGAPPPEDAGARPAVKLRLLVLGDPELARAVEQLEGEWNARSGTEYQIESIEAAESIPEEKLGADVILAASRHLGPLAERRQILPVPRDSMRDAGGHWSGIFHLVSNHEAFWRGQAMGVPLGSPVLTVYYRADLLEQLGQPPPGTWAEYQRLALLLGDRKNLARAGVPGDGPWQGALEPLGKGWGGLVLLARAAAYATHRGNYSTLFNVDSMTPLVDGPPFVRALEELVAAAKTGSADVLSASPDSVRTTFWAGRCGMALSWPTAARKLPAPAGGRIRVGFAELPGSPDVYDVSERRWESRREKEDRRVPLLAVAGRVGMVGRGTVSPETAFQLLFWLSSDQWSWQGRPVAAASPATTLFRKGQVKAAAQWVEEAVPAAAAAQYGLLAERTFSRTQSLLAPRIPGQIEYLSALDAAVGRAVRGEQTPRQALAAAAAQWQKITDRLGRPRQLRAYGDSVGLE